MKIDRSIIRKIWAEIINKGKKTDNNAKNDNKSNNKTDENSLVDYSFNGKIENTKQGKFGNCWLLSSVNSLNNTPNGKKIIDNVLEDKGDTITVHLSVGDYTYTKEFIKSICDVNENYSTGDLDMNAIEFAMNDAIRQINDGIIGLNATNDKTSLSFYRNNHTQNTIEGGKSDFAFLMLTGRETITCKEQNEKEEALKVLSNGKDNIMMVANTPNTAQTIKDVNGNEVKIFPIHAYSVKSVDKDTVTIVNPHDSAKEIKISKNDFLKIFEDLQYVNLNDKNKIDEHITQTKKINRSKVTDTKSKNTIITDIEKETGVKFNSKAKVEKEEFVFDNPNVKTTNYYVNGEIKMTVMEDKNTHEKTVKYWGSKKNNTIYKDFATNNDNKEILLRKWTISNGNLEDKEFGQTGAKYYIDYYDPFTQKLTNRSYRGYYDETIKDVKYN